MKTNIENTFLAHIEGVYFADQAHYELAKNTLEHLENEGVKITDTMVKDFKLGIDAMVEHAEILNFHAFEFDLQAMIQNHELSIAADLTETNHQSEEFYGEFLSKYGIK